MKSNLSKNKIILITGACGRVGTAVAIRAACKGIDVIISDIDINKLNKLKKRILIHHKIEVFVIVADISSHKGINSLLEKSRKFKGLISAAVNAAYPRSNGWGCKIEELKEDNLKEDLFSQLGGAILFSKEIIKIFQSQGFGNLINISSIQGLMAPKFDHYEGTNMHSPIEYSAIKAGIISITKWLAKYYSNQNIRVNCVSPGGILDNQPESFLDRYSKSCTNIGMLSAEEHIADTIIFLISDKSSAINGQNIIIDDGWSL